MTDPADPLRMILGLIAAEMRLKPEETARLEAMIRVRHGGERIYVARRITDVRLTAPDLLPPVAPRQARRLRRLKKIL